MRNLARHHSTLIPTMATLCAVFTRTSAFHHSSYPMKFSAFAYHQASRQANSFPHYQSLTTLVHAARPSRQTSSPYESIFLNQVEQTIQNVLNQYKDETHVLELPPEEREAVSVARHLHKRINSLTRNHDCRRCWLQQAHCYCEKCPSIQPPFQIHRIFVLLHHKEICLAVDTARLLLSSFPDTSRLVVGGIGAEYQASMAEMKQAMKNNNKCLVLYTCRSLSWRSSSFFASVPSRVLTFANRKSVQ